ncbi:MAG: metallophosphoesterase [bacterium]|nr:metallophosphoesterase [bacterium]
MRILVVADEESKSLWDYYEPSKLADIDLIISCGDLSAAYLSFLVTMGKAPVLYIHGNHDIRYQVHPPEGCTCIDGMLYEYKGLRILGLGGCMRYKPGPYQFTEKEMKHRIWHLYWDIFRSKGFDILVTHAPAYQFHDGDDLPHKGFQCFIDLMEKYKPKYFIHGHNHLNYGGRATRVASYKDTTVINAYQSYIIDIDVPAETPKWKFYHRKQKEPAAEQTKRYY